MNEKGNVMLAVAIILALIVIGWIVTCNALGIDLSHSAKQCYEVIYNSGVKDVICQ